MAEVRISDVIVPEVLSDMVAAMIVDYIDFVALGIATKDYGNKDISDGGHFAEVPFYEELTGDDEVLTDDTSLVPQKISTGKDIGVVCHRGKAWASRDLAKILSGDDPMKEIARQVSKYWGKRGLNTMIQVLNGVFDPTSGALAGGGSNTHFKKIGADDTAAVVISASGMVGVATKLGDMMDEFDCIVVHSLVYADMLREKLVTFPERNDPSTVTLKGDKGKFLGLDIVVSDDLPVTAGASATFNLYTGYLMKKGCMYWGMQKELMTEEDRDILAKKDILSTDIHFVPHLKLVKWNTTDTNPSNTDLATPGNWTKVATDDKFIGCVAFQVNATQ